MTNEMNAANQDFDPDKPRDKPAVDAAMREAIARQSADRYRREIANINRTSDSEMERALQGRR